MYSATSWKEVTEKYTSLFIMAWIKELLHLYSELNNEYISLRIKAVYYIHCVHEKSNPPDNMR